MRLNQLQSKPVHYLYEGLDRDTTTSMILWEHAGIKLKEAQLTATQIQQLFQEIEAGTTAAGGNRTLLGLGKDAATAVNKAWEDLKTKVQNSGPIKNVDAAYDSAVAKIEKGLGGPDGAVSQAIQKYRKFAKDHPIAQGLIYSALIAAAGISGAGLGGAAVLGLLKMTDKLLQGEKFSSAAYSGAKTGALAYGASKVGDYIKGKMSEPPPGGGVKPDDYNMGDQGSAAASNVPIKGANGLAKEAERIFREKVAAGEVTDYNSYQQGMHDSLQQALQKTSGNMPMQSRQMAGDILRARLDSVAARAAGGEFSGSGPEKVQAVIQAMGGKVDQDSIDRAKDAARVLSGAGRSAAATATDTAANTATDVGTKVASTAADLAGSAAPYGANMDPDYLQRVVDAAGKSGVRFKIDPEAARAALDWQAQNGGQAASMGANVASGAAKGFSKDYLEKVLSGEHPRPMISKEKAAALLKQMTGESIIWTKKLSEGQVYLVFKNLTQLNDRMISEGRLVEGPLDAIKGAAAKGASWLAKKGHNLTTKVTADKLNSAWQKAGSPMDSGELAQFLAQQGISDQVIASVYGKMSLPEPTEPAGKTEPKMDEPATAQPATEPTTKAATSTVTVDQVQQLINKLPTDRKIRLINYMTKKLKVA